jgi:exosortase A-associated hydrolase 1
MSDMNGYHETPLLIACEQEQLVGVVSAPAAPPAHDLGVVIIVGGPQYRAGSHRHFVQLARGMAAGGYPALRFDCRGMGDSTGTPPGFEHQAADIAAAIAALQAAAPSVKRIVLWGLCDGASSALLYLDERGQDPRVAGLCLLNPWVRTEATEASVRVRHYYLARLLQATFWAKLLRGGVGFRALRGFVGQLAVQRAAPRTAAGPSREPYPRRMARAFNRFEGHLLLCLSGKDLTAREFEMVRDADALWTGKLAAASLRTYRAEPADHTFSASRDQAALDDTVLDWMRTCLDRHAPSVAAATACADGPQLLTSESMS